VVRSMPVNEEVAEASGYAANVHQRETTAEMVELACSPELTWNEVATPAGEQGWSRVVGDLERALAGALGQISFERLVDRFDRAHATERVFSNTGIVIPLTAVRRVGNVAQWIAWICALVVLGFTIAVGVRGYSPLPFFDQWGYIEPNEV